MCKVTVLLSVKIETKIVWKCKILIFNIELGPCVSKSYYNKSDNVWKSKMKTIDFWKRANDDVLESIKTHFAHVYSDWCNEM